MKKLNSFLVVLLFAVCLNVNAQNIEPDLSSLSLPVIDWSLAINLDGLAMKTNSISPDGKQRNLLVENKDLGLTVSVFIEPAHHKGDHTECRKYYWAKAAGSPLKVENIVNYEKSDIAFVEHDVKEFQGQTIDYHSLNAYLSKDDYWIDVHISKTFYSDSDRSLFDNIVKSLKIETPKKQNIPDLFIFGSKAFSAGNYKEAIKNYESILESETEKISFDKTIWTVVVDNLGMAYALSGDFNNSRRVYDYGTKMSPNYPNFYYNRACIFAETSDLDNAIKQLEIAYSKKEYALEGEGIPNPGTDSSFEKYKNDKKFIEFLKKHGL